MELLIVLAILAVLIGIAAPALYRQLERQQERAALDEIESAFLGLPGAARDAGADLVVRAPDSGEAGAAERANPPRAAFILPLASAQTYRLPAPPPGWIIALERPFWVRYDGVCESVRATVTPPRGEAISYRLSRYSCAPERISQDAQDGAT